MRIHLIVGQLVDPAVLEKMKVKPAAEADATGKMTISASVETDRAE